MFSKPKLIYFDVGGVLLHFYHIRDQVAARIGVDSTDLGTLLHELETERSRGTMSEQTVEDLIRKQFQLTLAPGFWADLKWVHEFQPILPMHELVAELARHYRVGVLSNVNREIYEEGKDIPGLWPAVRFEPLILSFKIKLAKPDPEIFHYAVRESGCETGELLFIDDVAANIAAAAAIGMQTFQFNPAQVNKDVARLRALLLENKAN